MGEIEQAAKKKLRKGQIEREILSLLDSMEEQFDIMTTRRWSDFFRKLDAHYSRKRDPGRRAREVLYRLRRKGYVRFEERSERSFLRLAARGKSRLHKLAFGELIIPKPMKWDGQWRMVIFDIPEKRRHLRDRARALVARLGFYRLQHSVWVHPYECEEIIVLLKGELQIGKDLLYVVGAAVEYDRPLRDHFGLS